MRTLASLERFTDRRLGAVVLFVLALGVYAVQAVDKSGNVSGESLRVEATAH